MAGDDGKEGTTELRRKSLRVPTSNDFIFPVLDWASKHNEFERSDAVKSMVEHFNLSEEAKSERIAKGNALRHEDRTMQAISNLKNAGFLEWKGQGRYAITNFGKRELASPGGRMTHAYLRIKMG